MYRCMCTDMLSKTSTSAYLTYYSFLPIYLYCICDRYAPHTYYICFVLAPLGLVLLRPVSAEYVIDQNVQFTHAHTHKPAPKIAPTALLTKAYKLDRLTFHHNPYNNTNNNKYKEKEREKKKVTTSETSTTIAI